MYIFHFHCIDVLKISFMLLWMDTRALSQILVISEDIGPNTEIYLGYYDIFVRNAFGNYRDILKEVGKLYACIY